jgi:predicted regulator of Ras-like GTPase activity (Roadblock/LC7/MglB family)
MPESTEPPSAPPLRLRQRPVEKIRLPAARLARLVDPRFLLREMREHESIELNADRVLAHIVPHLTLADLAEASPDLFAPGSGIVRIPPPLLAAAYFIEEESCAEDDRFQLPENGFESSRPSPVHSLSRPAAEPLEKIPEISIPELPSTEFPTEPPTRGSAPEPAPMAEPAPVADQPHRLIELIQRLPTFHRFAPSQPPTLLLETEPCGDSSDLPDQDALQSLFLTEEKLTVRRVVELCGTLPGIRSCVLTHADLVVSAHNVPEGLDLVSMSATAARMLDAMQESANQLGLGQIPALTLHTERGPLSVVRQGGLAMLVVHADRGFIPGVREKLAAALGELSRAPLALPRPASPEN